MRIFILRCYTASDHSVRLNQTELLQPFPINHFIQINHQLICKKKLVYLYRSKMNGTDIRSYNISRVNKSNPPPPITTPPPPPSPPLHQWKAKASGSGWWLCVFISRFRHPTKKKNKNKNKKANKQTKKRKKKEKEEKISTTPGSMSHRQ